MDEKDKTIQFLREQLQKQGQEKDEVIRELRALIANLQETIEELRRMVFGTSSEKTGRRSSGDSTEGEITPGEDEEIHVQGYTRTKKAKSVRKDLYESLPLKRVDIPVPDEERNCPDCDGYSAYGKVPNVILVCCLAHCRRKFYDAVPANRRKRLKLLDIHSEQKIPEPVPDIAERNDLTEAEKGVLFCNRLFFMEQLYQDLAPEERKYKREEKELPIWEEFWQWLETVDAAGVILSGGGAED